MGKLSLGIWSCTYVVYREDTARVSDLTSDRTYNVVTIDLGAVAFLAVRLDYRDLAAGQAFASPPHRLQTILAHVPIQSVYIYVCIHTRDITIGYSDGKRNEDTFCNSWGMERVKLHV